MAANLCDYFLCIQTIEGGQKDALLRKVNIKKRTICALRPTFEKLFTGAKVQCKAPKIGIWRKTIHEIDPGIKNIFQLSHLAVEEDLFNFVSSLLKGLKIQRCRFR